jgi:hypothetical protein
VRHANDVPDSDRAGAAGAVQELWDDPITDDLFVTAGAIGWAVAVIAAAVAIRRAGAPLSAAILLGLSAIVLQHGPPVGPVGLLFFVAAVLLLARAQARYRDRGVLQPSLGGRGRP